MLKAPSTRELTQIAPKRVPGRYYSFWGPTCKISRSISKDMFRRETEKNNRIFSVLLPLCLFHAAPFIYFFDVWLPRARTLGYCTHRFTFSAGPRIIIIYLSDLLHLLTSCPRIGVTTKDLASDLAAAVQPVVQHHAEY